MAHLEQTGKFKAVGQKVTYGTKGKTIKKFYIDIDVESQYPTIGEFQFFGEKIALNQFKPGDQVKVKFSISGKKRPNKDGIGYYFAQNLDAFDMVSLEQQNIPEGYENVPQGNPEPPLDDLPF